MYALDGFVLFTSSVTFLILFSSEFLIVSLLFPSGPFQQLLHVLLSPLVFELSLHLTTI